MAGAANDEPAPFSWVLTDGITPERIVLPVVVVVVVDPVGSGTSVGARVVVDTPPADVVDVVELEVSAHAADGPAMPIRGAAMSRAVIQRRRREVSFFMALTEGS
jgi:hypothetical protein